MLNTPSAVLAVLVVVVAVNIFLFYGLYSPRTTPPSYSPPQQTERTTATQPATTTEQTPRPRTTLDEETATSTATPTATTTPSP